jgi:hypothetical protein
MVLAVVLMVPVGISRAQTSSTAATTSTTETTATSTTTTLPICFPGNPNHQLGVTCQLPLIDCTGPNPAPPCGNFPVTPTGGDLGEGMILTAPPDPGSTAPLPPAGGAPPPAARPARLSLAG